MNGQPEAQDWRITGNTDRGAGRETALWTGWLAGPEGQEHRITAQMRWENSPEEMGEGLPEKLTRVDEQGGREFQPGLYLTVLVDGEHMMSLEMPETRMTLREFAEANNARDYVTWMLEMTLPGYFRRTGAPPTGAMIFRDNAISPNEMMDEWPRTPTRERFEAAISALRIEAQDLGLIIPGNSQVTRDMENLEEMLETEEFEKAGLEEIQEKLGGAVDPMFVATMIGKEADTPTTIGLTLACRNPQDHQMSYYGVSRVSRNPDWMGMSRALPELRDTRVDVMESKERPGRPGLIIATRSGEQPQISRADSPRATANPGEPSTALPSLAELTARDEAGVSPGETGTHGETGTPGDFPPGEASWVRDLLVWHGVRECRWVYIHPIG